MMISKSHMNFRTMKNGCSKQNKMFSVGNEEQFPKINFRRLCVEVCRNLTHDFQSRFSLLFPLRSTRQAETLPDQPC